MSGVGTYRPSRSEQPAADIAFKLKFTKTRERNPDTRSDFEPALVTLADDTWASERGEHVQTTKRKPPTDLALDVLNNEIARGNGIVPPPCERIPPYTPCITAAAWRKAYEQPSIAENKDAAERAFYRAAKDLIEKRKLVAKHEATTAKPPVNPNHNPIGPHDSGNANSHPPVNPIPQYPNAAISNGTAVSRWPRSAPAAITWMPSKT
jgi:hypothetical protein